VTVVERTNIRHADPTVLGAPFDLVVADLSFISLGLVLDRLIELAGHRGELVLLVKPQFEAGKARVGKRGVVKDPAVHADVLSEVVRTIGERGWAVTGLAHSPIKGPEGNIEFWVRAQRFGHNASGEDVAEVVAAAHNALGG
jgi:23S rRNA (cytidine1920-2'-O)/16S rRNA (cytidine1409-2'-O)-methyltransferase